MLVKGRLDCIMMKERAFDYQYRQLKAVADYSDSDVLPIKTAVIGTDPVYIGYSEKAINSGKYPYAYRFKKTFDKVIYQMIKSGEVKSIMKAYRD